MNSQAYKTNQAGCFRSRKGKIWRKKNDFQDKNEKEHSAVMDSKLD